MSATLAGGEDGCASEVRCSWNPSLVVCLTCKYSYVVLSAALASEEQIVAAPVRRAVLGTIPALAALA